MQFSNCPRVRLGNVEKDRDIESQGRHPTGSSRKASVQELQDQGRQRPDCILHAISSKGKSQSRVDKGTLEDLRKGSENRFRGSIRKKADTTQRHYGGRGERNLGGSPRVDHWFMETFTLLAWESVLQN